MGKIYVFGGGTAVVLVTCSLGIAADLPPNLPIKAPVPSGIYDWTGFYLGGHVGYCRRRLRPWRQSSPLAGRIPSTQRYGPHRRLSRLLPSSRVLPYTGSHRLGRSLL